MRCACPPAEPDRLFCPSCGKLRDRAALKSVRLAGAIGVAHSSSDSIAEFWATGDPTVFQPPSASASEE